MRKLLLLTAALGAAGYAGAKPDDFTPPRTLSEWKLLENGKPASDVLPFKVRVPLFSDYAEKDRFLRLPKGEAAVYRGDGSFEFPVGTVLAKSFSYSSTGVLETRLLVRRPSGWIGLPYVWDKEHKEAVLKPAGVSIEGVDTGHGSVKYLVPNMNQCKACHEAGGRGSLAPLGTTAANLGSDQVKAWSKAGLLKGAPAATPSYPLLADAKAPLEQRARAYLAVNCAHCHNPKGPADTAGLDLRFSQKSPIKLGVHKAPVAAGRGTGGRQSSIVPGKPDESIFIHRMESVEPGVMMPELGRKLADAEGLALLRRWIAALPLESK